MTSVLLTGATGLVGPRVLPRLVDAGFEVRALVRREVELPEGATAVRGDLADPDSLQPAVEGVDAVVHLAALFRTDDEDAIWKANRDGTANLIAAVKAHAPQARLVMASTINIYDADASRPGREDDESHPAAAYPASKLAAEQLLRESGLTWAVLRLPFIYGEGDGHIEALPAMVPRMGYHPAQGMSVAHHRDIAAAMVLALSGATDGRVVNVADDMPITIYELTEIAGEPMSETAEPLRNPWASRADVSLARSLGFVPSVPTVRAAQRAGIL